VDAGGVAGVDPLEEVDEAGFGESSERDPLKCGLSESALETMVDKVLEG